MCQERFHSSGSCNHTPPAKGADRRAFLRNAGLAGAGAVALSSLTAATASADTSSSDGAQLSSAGRWEPDTESLRFTLAVMPDTQFLYWGSQGSVNPAPQEASFRYVLENNGDRLG